MRKFAVFFCMFAFCATQNVKAENLNITAFYGTYDGTKKDLSSPKTEKWVTVKPKKKYHIGILIPHLQDPFWVSVAYAINAHAKELGLKVSIKEAGGYINVGQQISQFKEFINKKVDGIILASVDYNKLDAVVAEAIKAGIPVVGLINDTHTPNITAKSIVPSDDIGYKVGEYVMKRANGKDIKVAHFPGPQNSGWADAQYEGFVKATKALAKGSQKVTVLPPSWGDSRPDVQAIRLKSVLDTTPVDYIVGCAPAAAEAVTYLAKNKNKQPNAVIVSDYVIGEVYAGIQNGTILATTDAQAMTQTRISMDMITRIINGEKAGKDMPFWVAAILPVITKENIAQFSINKLFGDLNYKPVFEIE